MGEHVGPKRKNKASPRTSETTASSDSFKKQVQETTPSGVTTPAKKTGSEASTIPADVLKRAEELGMIGSLQNLACRREIIGMGLASEKILDALVDAEGLVNKAKNALLATDPSTPVKCNVVVAPGPEATRVTPEKQAGAKDAVAQKDGDVACVKETNLSAMQRARIGLNRELALAREAQHGQ